MPSCTSGQPAGRANGPPASTSAATSSLLQLGERRVAAQRRDQFALLATGHRAPSLRPGRDARGPMDAKPKATTRPALPDECAATGPTLDARVGAVLGGAGARRRRATGHRGTGVACAWRGRAGAESTGAVGRRPRPPPGPAGRTSSAAGPPYISDSTTPSTSTQAPTRNTSVHRVGEARPGTGAATAGRSALASPLRVVEVEAAARPATWHAALRQLAAGCCVPALVNRIDRKIAVPSEPPTCRKNVTDDVATPMSRGSTEFCMASTMRLHVHARARDRTSPCRCRSATAGCRRRSRVSSSRPTTMRTDPMTGKILYRPVREVI